MNFDELIKLTRDYEDVILAHQMTRAEVVMFLALLKERVMAKVNGGETAPKPPSAPVTAVVEVEPPISTRKPIKYDPVFDPPPPMDVETPPPQNTPTGRILVTKNHACVCSACTKVAYIVNRDIPDNCKVDFFIASFTPMEGVPPITRKNEIQNIDGQISTDCPLCGANKTLYLTGKKGLTI